MGVAAKKREKGKGKKGKKNNIHVNGNAEVKCIYLIKYLHSICQAR